MQNGSYTNAKGQKIIVQNGWRISETKLDVKYTAQQKELERRSKQYSPSLVRALVEAIAANDDPDYIEYLRAKIAKREGIK